MQTLSFYDDDRTPKCPRCDSSELRHSYVKLFERPFSSGVTIRTTVHETRAEHGFSHHRFEAVAIGFQCRACDGEAELNVTHDNGTTRIEWSL
jgi:hypothetical protein